MCASAEVPQEIVLRCVKLSAGLSLILGLIRNRGTPIFFLPVRADGNRAVHGRKPCFLDYPGNTVNIGLTKLPQGYLAFAADTIQIYAFAGGSTALTGLMVCHIQIIPSFIHSVPVYINVSI